MGESLDSAVNSLSEQTKKINIALFYTSNDMDKAKQMVAGSYKDLLVLKIKFTSSSLYGAFLIFISMVHIKILDSFLVASNDYLIENIANTNDWKVFEKEISSSRDSIKDFRLIQEIKDKFERGFSTTICNSILRLTEKNDSIQLSHVLQKFLQDETGLQRVDINIDYQTISSLEMELDSISTRKIESMVKPADDQKDNKAEEKSDDDKDELKPGVNGIKAIMRSSLILSPIKGKDISELKIGDRVLISLIDNNDHTRSLAKAFNAYNAEENRLLPIPSRIKSIRYIDGVGFKIYVVIAKGIIGQIIEEEKNIKVALDPAVTVEVTDDKETKGISGLTLIIGLFAIIIVLLAVIIVIAL